MNQPQKQNTARRKQMSQKRKTQRLILLLAAVFVVLVGGYFILDNLISGARLPGGGETAINPEEDPIVLVTDDADTQQKVDAWGATDGMRHVLLLGLDRRAAGESARSDTIILATLDDHDHVIKLTSFMRDMYVTIPGKGKTRINAAFVYGGPELLMQTLEHNFGIQVKDYVAIDFLALADVIDQVGGIVLDVEEAAIRGTNISIDEYNRLRGIEPNTDGFLTEPGLQKLSGKQAQAYARCRYYTKDGDFGRTVRQRTVIRTTADKLFKQSVPDLLGMIVANLDMVETNLDVADIGALLPKVVELGKQPMQELRIPVDGGYSNKKVSGMEVLAPDFAKNVDALKSFLFADKAAE